MDRGQSRNVRDRFLGSRNLGSDSDSLVRAFSKQANDLAVALKERDRAVATMRECSKAIRLITEELKKVSPSTLKFAAEGKRESTFGPAWDRSGSRRNPNSSGAFSPRLKNRSTQTGSWTPPPPASNWAQSTERGYGTRSPTTSNWFN